eukprot:1146429-Pelagomonas_calceolata.AAC.2
MTPLSFQLAPAKQAGMSQAGQQQALKMTATTHRTSSYQKWAQRWKIILAVTISSRPVFPGKRDAKAFLPL